MKAFKQICLGVLLMTLPFVGGCDAMLDSDSERYNFEEDARLQTLHDTLYHIVGIFSEMQKLGDRYILLGELRADLMKVTDDASIDMKEIYYFNMSPDNAYAEMKTYYSIINQCNYIIHYADTAYTEKSDKPLLRIYATAKSIRAWTYMQLALNYGNVCFSEQPILSVQEAEQNLPLMDRDNLFSYLISDLLPLKDIRLMDPGIFGNFDASRSVFPIPLLLGDLYLWEGEYAQAAAMYYELIFEENLVVNSSYTVEWGEENNAISTNSLSSSWFNCLMMQNQEVVSALGAYPNYGQSFSLDSLSVQEKIMPTQVALDKWLNAVYYLNASSTKMGDLRIYDVVNGNYSLVKMGMITVDEEDESIQELIKPTIRKFSRMDVSQSEDDPRHLPIYRSSHVYLRYAEAINRLGYPQLAFAVMKNGLKLETMSLPHLVAEMASTDSVIPYFLSFNYAFFDNNAGTRMRGSHNVHEDETFFIIPDSITLVQQGYVNYGTAPVKQDTIDYVENVLLEEMAMELAFEGNRFQDLMRVAIRRGDNAYLADRVAAKYEASEQAAMHDKLMSQDNWFIPQE
ncbi:MAG: RagB/SusD family nutrient uptake outer membrane protein [Bacteroidales bacterium]|nr:RagB/SusD family nutrient uptake outer membrane protein [Bacteroidales bacterium]